MKRLVLIAAVLLWSALSFAQATPKIYWEHDGDNVTYFDYILDDTLPAVSMGLPTPSGQTYSYPVPELTAGQHTLVIRACNGTTCTAAVAIYVVKL